MSDEPRLKRAGVESVAAECANCGWTDDAKGALGRAARHHDRTGHEVAIRTVTVVVYGNRAAALEAQGQTALEIGGP